MQPPRAGQADLVGGVEHARGLAQQLASVVKGQRLQERLGGEAGPAAEQVMQFVGRDAGGMGDRLDLGLGAPVLGDIGDGAADDAVVVDGPGA